MVDNRGVKLDRVFFKPYIISLTLKALPAVSKKYKSLAVTLLKWGLRAVALLIFTQLKYHSVFAQ